VCLCVWGGSKIAELIPHRHAVDRPQLLSDGEDVQQRLGWMLPDAVSSVDHRLTAMTRCTLGSQNNLHVIGTMRWWKI